MVSVTGRPEAIVRPAQGAQAFDVERIAPATSLSEFVDYYWLVRWHVPEPFHQQVVPQPRVHIAAEDDRLFVHGVNRKPFFRTLFGRGHVLGAAFHPGGFRPLLKAAARGIHGTVRTGLDVLGIDDRPAARQILGTEDSASLVRPLETYLLATEPECDPFGRQVTELVHEVQRRSDLVRAEQLAAHAGVSLRSLQRLFSEYVGIGPKWVIQRSRILDVTATAHSAMPADWTALAHELGFSDQAHLTRVFTQVVGTPPAAYQSEAGTTTSRPAHRGSSGTS